MGDNGLWEDDPKGYDGWLQPHAKQEQDKGDLAIRLYDRAKDWWFLARCALGSFIFSAWIFYQVEWIPGEQSFFYFVMIISMVVFAISVSSSMIADRNFDQELTEMACPDGRRTNDS